MIWRVEAQRTDVPRVGWGRLGQDCGWPEAVDRLIDFMQRRDPLELAVLRLTLEPGQVVTYAPSYSTARFELRIRELP